MNEAALQCNNYGSLSRSCAANDSIRYWACEVKRRAEMASVEQLIRYLDYLNRDPLLAPVGGILAALTIPPQVQVYASDQGIRYLTVDYDDLRGMKRDDLVLF